METKQLTLGSAMLTDVHEKNRAGTVKTRLLIEAVLSSAEQKRLHIHANEFASGALKNRFAAADIKLVPPDGLKVEPLAVSIDRAAQFRVRELAAKEGRPIRWRLVFTAYVDGVQHEASEFMKALGEAPCRVELRERQGDLLKSSNGTGNGTKKKRGRPPKQRTLETIQ